MSSHSASKGSEPGDRATSNVAESAPIAGQEFTHPRPTHASGLRERVQPSESEPPTPVDSGGGFMRRLAAPGGS